MQTNQTVTKMQHSFSLVCLKDECHFKSIFADFTPPPNLNKASNSIMPSYLQDGKFYTQAFVICREKDYYCSASSVERFKFEVKISKANQLFHDLQDQTVKDQRNSVPLPVPTTNYCQICKGSYQHYEEHLKQASHLRQSKFSKANTYITQLCKIFASKSKKSQAKGGIKSKGIQKGGKSSPIKENKIKRKDEKKGKVIKAQTSKINKLSQSRGQIGTKQHNYSTNVPSLLPLEGY